MYFKMKCTSRIWMTVYLFTITLLCFIYVAMKNDVRTNKKDISHRKNEKKPVKLVVGILSILTALNRRNAIRLSWFQVCEKNPKDLACVFFTDSFDEQNATNTAYLEEQQRNNDLQYMPYRGGYNFSLRLIWMLNFFTRNYNFDYFIRVDDDYFLCLDHILYEVSKRPPKSLYWGYIHCTRHVVRVDEGFMILTRDIIEEALAKVNTTLMCSALGDQAVALWVADSKLNITYFSDNDRVIHAATGYKSKEYQVEGLCQKYLGLHGSYPKYMLNYWKLVNKQGEIKNNYKIPMIRNLSDICEFSTKFDWTKFWPDYRFEPKLCRKNPSWTKRAFIGREELGHEQIF